MHNFRWNLQDPTVTPGFARGFHYRVGALFLRYKFRLFIIPIIGIVSAVLLTHFEPDNYGTITGLSDFMPKLIAADWLCHFADCCYLFRLAQISKQNPGGGLTSFSWRIEQIVGRERNHVVFRCELGSPVR
jgi:hypothetical protein